MGHEAVRAAVEGRIQANWTSTNVKYQNVPFNPPGDDDYIAIFISHGEGNQIGMPADFRYNGVVQIQIFTNKESGTKNISGYVDELTTLFRGVQFSGITCRTPYPSPGQDVGAHHMVVVNIPFYWDDSV